MGASDLCARATAHPSAARETQVPPTAPSRHHHPASAVELLVHCGNIHGAAASLGSFLLVVVRRMRSKVVGTNIVLPPSIDRSQSRSLANQTRGTPGCLEGVAFWRPTIILSAVLTHQFCYR